jgi:hypothetical protein
MWSSEHKLTNKYSVDELWHRLLWSNQTFDKVKLPIAFLKITWSKVKFVLFFTTCKVVFDEVIFNEVIDCLWSDLTLFLMLWSDFWWSGEMEFLMKWDLMFRPSQCKIGLTTNNTCTYFFLLTTANKKEQILILQFVFFPGCPGSSAPCCCRTCFKPGNKYIKTFFFILV